MQYWNLRISRRVILAAMLMAGGQAVAQQDADILRESVGARAAELAAMELKPFDQTLWSSLSSWTNGQPLDAAATQGNVVLIATWASWNPAATRAISTMQNLHAKYATNGLIVVGVHHAQGWDKAEQAMDRRKADFLIALDAEGKFREAIKSDQDPDFYVIDRAGQLRFADIRTESVQAAVKLLLAEDVASAGSLVSRLEAAAAAREVEFRKPTHIQGRVNLASMPEVAFLPPSEVEYSSANWPEVKKDDDNRRRNENTGPRPFPVPGNGWVEATPPKTDGRVMVYYTWELDDPRGAEIVRQMNTLQRKLGRDAVIVGVLTGVRSKDNNNRRNNENMSAESLIPRLANFRRTHGVEHAMIVDPGGSNTSFKDSGRSRGSGDDYVAVVVSSDSITRWEGTVRDPAFRAALDRVIDADPGVRTRRAAEDAYIRAKGG
ncbi:hypothetical protein MNBD_PLANCTO03-659 [hydrothermal vent metagenome]|uniref:Redoxin domain-containing protein n=1 Tax=hydrothermal vent metagenome TaxID=652676 RepID=A0A3B1DLP3_9ZZZZ